MSSRIEGKMCNNLVFLIIFYIQWSDLALLFFFFFKILFFYQRERGKAQAGRAAGEGEAGSPLSKEPGVGLNPRTLGSRPKPKADAQDIPGSAFIISNIS